MSFQEGDYGNSYVRRTKAQGLLQMMNSVKWMPTGVQPTIFLSDRFIFLIILC